MITEKLSTLKIHKLSKRQYERELAAGYIDENALYLTPDDSIDDTLTQAGVAADAKAVGDRFDTIILSTNNYGAALPGTGEDGLVYFVEDTTVPDTTLSIEGAAADAKAVGDALDTKAEIELVWENASPSSEFAAQTVSLDLLHAGFVIIEFRTTSSGTARPTVIIANGKMGNLNWLANATANYEILVISRNATVSNTGITFEKGYRKNISSTTATENNASAIPTRIYAIKGAL